MKKYIVIVGVIVGLMTACNSTRQEGNQQVGSTQTTDTNGTKKEVPFQPAERYFVKNTVEDKNLTLKITNQEDFDNYFGAAATMGENGKPTVIDFSKQFVIAIIAESSSKEKNIVVSGLTSKGNELLVSYKIDEKGEDRSFVSRSLALMIVDNKYSGDVKFEKQ